MNETNWNEVARVINGLWPEANWGEEERALWQKKMNTLDAISLVEALESVACKNKRKKPALADVIEAYNAMRENQIARERNATALTPEARDNLAANVVRERAKYREGAIRKLSRYTEGDIFVAAIEGQRRYGLVPRKNTEMECWSTTSLHAVLHILEGDTQ